MTCSIINNGPDSEQDVTRRTLTFLRGLEVTYISSIVEHLAGLRASVVGVTR